MKAALRRNAHSGVDAAAVGRRCWQLLLLLQLLLLMLMALTLLLLVLCCCFLQLMMMLRLRLEASRRDAHNAIAAVASVVASRCDAHDAAAVATDTLLLIVSASWFNSNTRKALRWRSCFRCGSSI